LPASWWNQFHRLKERLRASWGEQIRNPKSEIRNKQQIQNPNIQNDCVSSLRTSSFDNSDLFRISIFGFRIS